MKLVSRTSLNGRRGSIKNGNLCKLIISNEKKNNPVSQKITRIDEANIDVSRSGVYIHIQYMFSVPAFKTADLSCTLSQDEYGRIFISTFLFLNLCYFMSAV